MSAEVTVSPHTGFQRAIPLERLSGFRRLACDYTAGAPQLAPFFAGDPTRDDAWTDAIARARGQSRDRLGIAGVLGAQLDARRAPDAAQRALERLRNPKTVAVVTGQQAGLFGGPLFTLLKALTAIRLADDVSRRLGVPCVSLFWVDAEDHDWNEVRGCSVLDAKLERRTVSLPAVPAAPAIPVGARLLDQSIAAALERLAATLAATDFTAMVLDQLRAAYAPGVSMATAYSGWLESVLGSRGLIVFDASDPAAKPFAADLFVRELTARGRTATLAAEAGARLIELGYQAQVTPQPDAVALFRLDEGGRQALKRRDGQLAWGGSSDSADVLAADAREHPARYSPNVLLRPLVQDVLFPTIACVAGPNELAYLGQLRGVYDAFEVPMPLMILRATATILDAGAARFLSRYDVAAEALQAGDERALNNLLHAQIPASVDASFEQAGAAIEERMAAIGAAIAAVDPTLAGAAKSTLARMEKDLSGLRGKVIQAAKRRDETLRRQFGRTQSLLFPGGDLQERALGFVYFLNRYGPALIDRLEAEMPLRAAEHLLVTV